MKASDVADVLEISSILQQTGTASETIAALIDWRDRTEAGPQDAPPAAAIKPTAKAGKATGKPETSPDPSADDEPGF